MSYPNVDDPDALGCVHLALWRGTCVDCLDDVTWPDVSTIGRAEAHTRKALARVRLCLRARGTSRPWGQP